MRVCHVCSSHTSDDSRVFHRYCVSLSEAGYEVHLVAQATRSEPFVNKGVTVHPAPAWRSRVQRLRHRAEVADLASSLEPDLFHVHEPELLGSIISRAGDRPVIWDVHESYLDVLSERKWIPGWARPMARASWDLWERRLLRRCAAVVPATELFAARYRPLHSRVQVVANYPEAIAPEQTPDPRWGERICVYAGEINRNCGLSQTVAALAILRQRGLDVQLMLAGPDDGYLESLLAEAERLGVNDLVTYHGVLPRSDVPAFLLRAGIGVVAHLPVPNYVMGLPRKLLEYMSLGLPVVHSAFDNYQEIGERSGAGIAVDPTSPNQIADAIERLIREPNLSRAMGLAGKEAIRARFNWATERDKLLALYEEVLKGTPPPSQVLNRHSSLAVGRMDREQKDDQETGWPFVSVVMAIRNEAAFIERSLGAVLSQDYPEDKLEVIVSDGLSTDGTRELLQRMQSEHPCLRLIDNPAHITAAGLNAALRVARGEAIVRVDGHTIVDRSYVRECIAALKRSGADNAGGRMTPGGTGRWGRAVAVATSHPFGVGGARFHYSNREEYVDTVYLGAWPREVFERIGGYDETLGRNEDDELNYRLLSRGGKILLSPRIRSQYFNRSTFQSLWRQYFQYGYWKVRVMQKHPRQMRPRQFVAPAFVGTLLLLALGSPFSSRFRLGLGATAGSYAIASLVASAHASRQREWSHLPLLPAVFATLHLSWGLGFLAGLLRFAAYWKGGSNPSATDHFLTHGSHSQPDL
ncbi:MAG: glycosyltransferase [Chloroflexota bacterium]|jgi:succinoglycan biosynthesis protein ExoA